MVDEISHSSGRRRASSPGGGLGAWRLSQRFVTRYQQLYIISRTNNFLECPVPAKPRIRCDLLKQVMNLSK